VVEETTREVVVQAMLNALDDTFEDIMRGRDESTRGKDTDEFKPHRKVRVQEQQFLCGEYCNGRI